MALPASNCPCSPGLFRGTQPPQGGATVSLSRPRHFRQAAAAALLYALSTASCRAEGEARAARARARRRLGGPRSPMEPLLARLAAGFSDDADLGRRLAALYQVRPPCMGSCQSH